MKIIYLHQYFKMPDENGGTRSFDLATSFVKLGYSVDMVTTTSIPPANKVDKWTVKEVEGIKVHYLYLPYDNSFSFFKRVWIFIQFIYYSLSRLLKIKGDIVLATSTPLTIGIPAILKKIFHGTPFIFEVRDVWPEAVAAIGAINNKLILKMLYKLEYYIYNKSEFIVPLSSDMKTSIVSRFPQFEKKIKFVIENISEIKRFSERTEISKNKGIINDLIGFTPQTSILYAGTFGKVNNIEYVIQLAEKIYEKDKTIVFLLLGAGSERKNLIELAKSIGVFEKNVFFINPIGKKDLPLIYSEVSVGSSFVSPIKELWANSANKFFDTLAAGRPIIINHYGWQAKEIDENNIGYVLNPQLNEIDLNDFVGYLNNKQLLVESGLRSRKLAMEKFSLEEAVKKYNIILQAVCNVN